ncbi:MAG: hypothetical protein K2F81_06810 [Ruminococcus sp.]|nr:hypothetical protein [Ruminococcus sp.]
MNDNFSVTKKGSFRFWGDWFGRPLDNLHKPMKCAFDKDILMVLFEDGEKLTVYNPENVVSNEGEFSIGDAAKILWEWYPYGETMAKEYKKYIEYVRSTDGKIVKRTNLGTGIEQIIDPKEFKAVETY